MAAHDILLYTFDRGVAIPIVIPEGPRGSVARQTGTLRHVAKGFEHHSDLPLMSCFHSQLLNILQYIENIISRYL